MPSQSVFGYGEAGRHSPDPAMTFRSMMSVRRWGRTMDEDLLWSHETVLAAEAGSAAKARAFVLQHLVEHRLLYLVDDVRMVAGELAANAVLHAQTAFTVTLEGRVRSVLLTVRDGSPTPPAPSSAAPDGFLTSGRGLFLVQVVSESWGVTGWQGDTKSVWASFQVREQTTRKPVV